MATENAEAEAFFDSTFFFKPKDLDSIQKRVSAFVASAVQQGRKVALVTSGGTTVPLEMNTVSCIDTFSTGTKGASCAEEFLTSGYSVVYLHREGSSFPFLAELGNLRFLARSPGQDPLKFLQNANKGTKGQLQQLSELNRLPEIGKLSKQMFAIPFTTIFDYLFLLRETCKGLKACGSSAVIFSAAAVSPFYIPEQEMANDGDRTEQMEQAPKLLGDIKGWAPEALLISFKLETNANILSAKAAGSIVKYGLDAVCSSLLASHRDLATVISRDPAVQGITIGKEDIAGDETKPVSVQGVQVRRVERGSRAGIDQPLIEAIIAMHKERTLRQCLQDSSRAAKRAKVTIGNGGFAPATAAWSPAP